MDSDRAGREERKKEEEEREGSDLSKHQNISLSSVFNSSRLESACKV